ncbi:MAG: FtsX-like permease family protein, partial [Pseudomonadota bacterium]
MEIRPIISAMLRNKTGAVLVALQVAFTLAIVVNATFIIVKRMEFVSRDSGMQVDNLIVLETMGFAADYDHESSLKEDRQRLANIPGVKSAIWTQQVPVSGGGSAEGFRSESDPDAQREGGNYYFMHNDALETLGVKLVRGRNFNEGDIFIRPDGSNVFPDVAIITQAMEEKLFGEGVDAVGKSIFDDVSHPITVIGVIEKMHGAWVSWDGLEQVVLFPGMTMGNFSRFMVSAEPEDVAGLVDTIENDLAQSSDSRIVRRVRPFSEIVDRSYSRDRAMAIVLGFVIVLLVVITTLGIIGLASFTVRQRTKQIGTRRAVGARKLDIVRYFLTENYLITTLGVILGAALTIGLNFYLAQEFELERLHPLYLPLGIVGLWILGLLAV